MGWLSGIVHKDTDLIYNLNDVEPSLKAIGFKVEKVGDAMVGSVMMERLKVQKGRLVLALTWDGTTLTILQKHDLASDPDFRAMQDFHAKNNYFVLTYGLPGRTLIVKHSILMSPQTPVVAATIRRILSFWDKYLNLSAFIRS